jgi:hypothetical protein
LTKPGQDGWLPQTRAFSVRSDNLAIVRPAKCWHVQWETVPPGEKSEIP